jgi:hypothetical protein
MKRNHIIGYLLILTAFCSCTKDPSALSLSSKLSLNTQAVTSIGQNAATSGVQVSGGFSSDVKDKGICWATTYEPTTADHQLSGGTGIGLISLNLTGLSPGNTYYVRGYVTTSTETIYGNQLQFNTQGYLPATLATVAVSNITLTTAASGGNVTALGGGMVSGKGVCWSTTSNPTIFNNKTSDGTGLGAYNSTLSGLTPGTLYYVRAYATNQAGTTYGQQVSFATMSITLATVSVPVISSVTLTSAFSSASVTADGGGTVSAKGICWSTGSAPTIAGARTVDGAGTGAYSSFMSNLSPGTIYYVRAYATNQAGTAYGPQVFFTTTAIQLATVSAITVTGITKISATVSGTVTDDGGGAISSRGICWSTGANPTVPASAYTSNGSGTGAVSASLTGLVTGTTYYLRAYAINPVGISYGALTSFRTL